MKKERAIKFAIDRNSGALLDADSKFRSAKEGHEIRELYSRRKLDLQCCECAQSLHLSKSIYDRLYFKHAPHANYCVLKDSSFSIRDIELIRKATYSRESDRHKYLKQTIAELLRNTPSILSNSVSADTKFLFDEQNKRRPDVYCKYGDKELVFEIQLSPLPQRYILDRYDFYRNKGIFLIWILDQFSVYGQSATEKDIKYLTTYQNFFKLDENSAKQGLFKLLCRYKKPEIFKNRSIISPWTETSVSLEEINYCMSSYQIYFSDFEKSLNLKHEELRQLEEKQHGEERLRELEEQRQRLRLNTDRFIDKIKLHRTNGSSFYSFLELYPELNHLDASYLNEKLDFNRIRHDGRTVLNHYISSAGEFDYSFVQFLLKETNIWIDVNLCNADGRTNFQEIFLSRFRYSGELMRLLFKRGYQLKEADKIFYEKLPEKLTGDKNEGLFLLTCKNRLVNRNLTEQVWRHSRLLCILESAKRNKMVGFKYKNWISLSILAISSYHKYWEYIEASFRKFGIWEELINSDRKGTFQKKLLNFYETMPAQDYSVDELITELFSEFNE